MSIAATPAPPTAGTEVKEGDRVVFTGNYKTESGVYALAGDTGIVSGEIVFENDTTMAFIIDLDRPRVRGFETLYVTPELIEPVGQEHSTAS